MNINDDLNEKIKKLEQMLSHFEVSKDKDFNLNFYTGGIVLDLQHNDINIEGIEEVLSEKESLKKNSYNMKNLNKNKLENYDINRNEGKRKKKLMEISELIQQKSIKNRILFENNDPNQISNLIDNDSKLDDNSSGLSDNNSETGNENKLYENSFDKPCYRSIDSQISEYAVQKCEFNDFKSRGEYETGCSIYNNLQFSSKKREEDCHSDKIDGYINSLWERDSLQNKESMKNLHASRTLLINGLNQFIDNNSTNKINLSSMLSNSGGLKNFIKNNNSDNSKKIKENSLLNKTKNSISMNTKYTKNEDSISYICNSNQSNSYNNSEKIPNNSESTENISSIIN